MPQHSDAVKAAIKHAVDIVALVGDYGFDIRRTGSTYKTLCPFHDDHNPSLVLNPDRQSYKCWSCGAGGDVFDFVIQYEKVEFPEAKRMLAERAGIALEPPQERERSAPSGPTKTELLAVHDWAKRQFVDALRRSPEVQAYLRDRGLSSESVDRFQLGYAPDQRDWLSLNGKVAGFGLSLLEAAGLISRKEETNLTHDRFRGRLIFPIHDLRGRTIAFGGRILPESEKKLVESGMNAAKYLNSPETLLFQKRRQLYAADLARDSARKTGWLAVVEGYTDVMAAHQAGVTNVVGTLGTALGDDHVTMLRRLTDRVVLVFDGDEAGQKAADRSLELFLTHEVDVRVLALPQGLDPCDFLLKEGSAPFLALVAGASDPLDFAVSRAAARFDFNAPEGVRQAAEWVLSLLGRIPSGDRAGLNVKVAKAIDKLSQRLRVPVDELRRQLRAQRRPNPTRVAEPGAGPDVSESVPIALTTLDPLDRALVQILLNEPSVVGQVITLVAASSLRDAPLRVILQACYDLYAEGTPSEFTRVAARLGEAERALAAGLLLPSDPLNLSGRVPPPSWLLQLEQTLAQFEERNHREQLRALRDALDSTDKLANPAEYRALFAEYSRLLTQRPESKRTPA